MLSPVKNKSAIKTTKGWKLKVLRRDGYEEWISLKDLKESYPVQTAEFSVSQKIHNEPAFKWWVPYTLKKRKVLVSAVKARIRRVSHKYGIEVPTSVEHAIELDKKNGNTFWADALKKGNEKCRCRI